MKNLLKQHLDSGTEDIPFSDFERLANCGETNLVERKSILNFRDINLNKSRIDEMLGKQISAFANYEGGFILIGVDDDGNIEAGIENTFGNTTVKEWLEDKIFTCTTPSVKKFEVKKISKDSKYLFAILIDESTIAPHQTFIGKNKHKYFSRIGGKSMPIDGVLVRDIFNRQSYANLKIIPKLECFKVVNTQIIAKLTLDLNNDSNIVAEKVAILMNLSEGVLNSSWTEHNVFREADKCQFLIDIAYPGILNNVCGKRPRVSLNRFFNLRCDFIMVARNMIKKEQSFNLRYHEEYDEFRINEIQVNNS